MLIYLLRCSAWSDNRLKNYRKDNGYKLYKDGHISNVQMYNIPNSDYSYVSATCVMETTLNEKLYIKWILQKKDGEEFSAGCAYVA